MSTQPAIELEIPSAMARTTGLMHTLESMVEELEKRLHVVLITSTPSPNDQKNLAPQAMNPVPLAADLHGIAARIETLINAHRNLLDRLHL